MEICEAFGLSMCPFDPMLKGLRGSGPTKGLPNASSAPPHQGCGGPSSEEQNRAGPWRPGSLLAIQPEFSIGHACHLGQTVG